MQIRGTKTKMYCFITALHCYMLVIDFGQTAELKACERPYLEQMKVYLSVNVVKNTLQIGWQNLDSLKHYLVLASAGQVSSFSKKREGEFQFCENGQQHVLETFKPTSSSAFVQTGVKFDRAQLERADSTGNIGYYVHITTPDGNVTKTYCMKIYPTWMNDYRSQIGNISLNRLFIPGTHNSASYFTHNSVAKIHTKDKYAITQGWEDIRSQLRLGARYLDIRIGQYRYIDESFWTVHKLVRMHTLRNVLRQVRKFVQETNEIVIFDIQHLEMGFIYQSDLTRLVQFILSEIGDLMVSPSIGWEGTLNDIWATGKNIVVGFGKTAVVKLFPDRLWSATRHRWPNADDKNKLKSFLYEKHRSGRAKYPVTDSAALTPRPERILGDAISSTLLTVFTLGTFNPLAKPEHGEVLFGGLNNRAQEINHDLTLWYLHDLGPTTNIVAVDYILGTNIVEVAIYWNLHKR